MLKEEIKEMTLQIKVPEVKEEMKLTDPFMPTLSEPAPVELPSKTTVEKSDVTPVFFEISSAADQIPVMEFDLNQFPEPAAATSINCRFQRTKK